MAAGALLIVGLTACAGPDEQGTPAHRLTAWESSSDLGSSIGTLQADSARIAQVLADGGGTGAIHADCALLLQDAGAANDNLPAPDQTVTDELSTAYGDEGSAANDCYNAGASGTALLARSARERVRAAALMARAAARVRAITGATVSTTTTTSPGSGSIFG